MMELLGITIPLPSLCSFTVALIITLGVSPIISNLLLTGNRKSIIGNKKPYLQSTLASSIHAIAATAISVYVMYTGELSVDPVLSTSSVGTAAMQMSLGYTVADLIVCLIDKHMRRDVGMILHHLAMMAGLGAGLYYRYFNYYIVFRSLSEFSTPFVNFWWIVHNLKFEGRKLYVCSSILMLLSFFACRIAVIPWINYKLQMSIYSTSALQVAWYLRIYMILNFNVFDLLNLFWFFKILRGAYKLFTKKSRTV